MPRKRTTPEPPADAPKRPRGRPPKPKPPPPFEPEPPPAVTPSMALADLSPRAIRRALLRDTLRDLDLARARPTGNQTAIQSLTRSVMALTREVEEAEREEEHRQGETRPTSGASDQELMDRLVAVVRHLPPEALDRLEDEILAVRAGTGARLQVVEG